MKKGVHKTVFHCCTVYQLIVAIQLKVVRYSDDWSELIISESTPNSESVAYRLKEIGIFDSVIVIDNESIDWNTPRMMIWKNIKRGLLVLLKESAIRPSDIIDEYLFAGLGGFSNAIGQWLMHDHHCKTISMYEEGASSYSRIYETAVNMRRANPSLLKRLYYFVHPHVLSEFSKFFFFEPALCLWDTKTDNVAIPNLLETKDAILPIINKVFAVDSCKDLYDEKVIFFEESYYGDGIATNDIGLVEELSRIYGKKNIFVKIHPRNKKNRFKELGYTTNSDFSIPWEAIALNIGNLDEKILATMTSTALISTFLCIRSNAQMIFYTSQLNSSNQRVLYTAEVIKKLVSLYPDKVKEG